MVVARVRSEGGFAVLEREVLFLATDFVSSPNKAQYAVSPDDQRFLMIQYSGMTPEPVFVLNFFEELKRLVPTN